ncbi:branched-chain amino acid ABC transporter substrate-binding protein [Pseudonocardia spinosispora]|uniref:branched-chain amino acid ABC transporter substrate-binding protein n=1 Tax=Pseudonocardia spinosispora TaxID=103441 RepID=UPI0004115B4D|nr:branched-chain amino acid ABC transporter substrate-binding protein [Pseudonocardia spinosispora]
MSRKRTAVLAVAVLAGAVALSACGGGGGASGGAAGDTLKIGFLGDLTGQNSGLGIPPRNGAKMAFDEYNATNPPKKIELVEYDSQGTPDQAVPLINRAITEDKIVGLVGPTFSGESKAADPVLEQAKIPNISASATNPGLGQNGWKFFHRVLATDAFQGPAVADFLIRAKSPKSAFVISDDQEYSVGLADAVFDQFKAKGTPVDRDQFAQTASDYSSSVAKIKADNPDVIFFGGYYAQGGRLLKQIRDAGITATFVSADGSLDVGLINGAGAAAAEGAVVACPCAVPGASSVQGALKTYYEHYKAKYGIDPAVYSTEGYDAATAFIKAIQAGNTTPETINTFLATLSFQGVAKPIKFQPNGDVEGVDIFIHQVKNGKLELLGPSTEAKLG